MNIDLYILVADACYLEGMSYFERWWDSARLLWIHVLFILSFFLTWPWPSVCTQNRHNDMSLCSKYHMGRSYLISLYIMYIIDTVWRGRLQYQRIDFLGNQVVRCWDRRDGASRWNLPYDHAKLAGSSLRVLGFDIAIRSSVSFQGTIIHEMAKAQGQLRKLSWIVEPPG